ncbi:MAG: gliding motility protein GldL [Duncaniella sp.]|nr:gliding motility protein GldL [Duncaniella sp.]
MTKESLRTKFQTMMTWEGGQRLFNAAYSIGAAIVIWGALFKILHLPGGNTLLCIGMGTEVLMFILTAFDRPPKEYHWEDVFPELDGKGESASAPLMRGHAPAASGAAAADAGRPEAIPGLSDAQTQSLTSSLDRMSAAAEQLARMADLAEATERYLSQMSAIADQMQRLHATTEALNSVSATLLDSYRAITENSQQITENSNGYITQMADLNRNIGGLNTIYEIQLKSVATQLDAIDRVNRGIKDIRDMYEKSASHSARYCEETEKMSRSMQQLNQVYEKMIGAMTVGMYRPPVPASEP